MIGPGFQIEVEAALKQVITISVITGGAEQVIEPDRRVLDFRKRQLDIALAGKGGVIHSDQHPFTVSS
jgi:hypothetical protein